MRYDPAGDAVLEKHRLRDESMLVSCPFCHEPAGFPCRNKLNGDQLERLPAHPARLKEANL